MSTVLYPYDPTGSASTNLVKDEILNIQAPAQLTNASFVFLNASPFFTSTLTLYTGPNNTGRRLIEGADYYLTHSFVAGTTYLNKPMAAGIALTDFRFSGTLYASYQTIGGDLVVNDAEAVAAMARRLYPDFRFITFDQIKGAPSAWPPTAHQHQTSDFVTLENLANSINGLAAAAIGAIGSSADNGANAALALIQQHLQATGVVHSPANVGLDKVMNAPVSSEQEALQGRPDRYTNPPIVSYLISRALQGENITAVRTQVTQLDTALASLQQTLATLTGTVNGAGSGVDSLASQVEQYRVELQGFTNTVNAINDQALNAVQIANQAADSAAVTALNLSAISAAVNNIIYPTGLLLTAGSYLINLPPNNAIRVELIGGGGGSGRYYNQITDAVAMAPVVTAGGDSQIDFIGTLNQAREPVPLLVAQGGLAGTVSFGSTGQSRGGRGGAAFRFRSDRINLSQITNVNLTNDLIRGNLETQGIDGQQGDTSSNSVQVNGVGGYGVDVTGDLTSQVFGRGMPGVSRAGTGGAGARWFIVINNDIGDVARFCLRVGSNGISARAVVNDDAIHPADKLATSGAAIITLVN